ncbi:putative Se/S carrier-like protein [Enterococcus rivorum]|uniref:Putative Se/S carrier protein-like domain-containing protein n=1 Tax=Enterococcus rivorum TaxID=762845 RepID=A0A1E5KWL7_9ENTE|nr:putative Se/S carrier-like protein [Enterococcus rivorum]MBP2100296.1 hypothetical protein [Enterococcus rivorum]OEH82019.1 hypothetical protein BCR26_15010 [Enterococcus rivorum]
MTFDSTHLAIEMEEVLNEKQQLAKIIAIPAAISAGCGLGLKMTEKQYREVCKKIPIKTLAGTTIYSKKGNAEYQMIIQTKTNT